MKRKRHTIGAPHQCLDPKKAYTFYFSDHLQDEDKLIDEVSQVLSTKLRCKVSLFLNEKVDVMVDSKRNTSAFRIGSFSSGERVSSPGGNNKESYSSSSFDGNQLQKQRATSPMARSNLKVIMSKQKLQTPFGIKGNYNINAEARSLGTRKKRQGIISSRSQRLLSMATSVCADSPKRSGGGSVRTPATNKKQRRNVIGSVSGSRAIFWSMIHVVLEDVMQYIRGRQRELNIKSAHLTNGVGYLRRASLTTQVLGSNAEKETGSSASPLYFKTSPCIRIANGVGLEEIKSFTNYFHPKLDMASRSVSSVPQIEENAIPGASPFCPYQKYSMAVSKGYVNLHTYKGTSPSRKHHYASLRVPWWIVPTNVNDNHKGFCEVCGKHYTNLRLHCKTNAHKILQQRKHPYDKLDAFLKDFYSQRESIDGSLNDELFTTSTCDAASNSSVETNRQESREYGRGEQTKESREDCQAGNSCKESKDNEAGQHINEEYVSSSSDEEVSELHNYNSIEPASNTGSEDAYASNSNGDMSETECNIDSQLRDPMDGYIGSECFLMDGKTEIIGDNWAIV